MHFKHDALRRLHGVCAQSVWRWSALAAPTQLAVAGRHDGIPAQERLAGTLAADLRVQAVLAVLEKSDSEGRTVERTSRRPDDAHRVPVQALRSEGSELATWV